MGAQQYLLSRLLDNAIRFEEASVAFYKEARSRVKGSHARHILDALAAEEQQHIKRLTNLRNNTDAAAELALSITSLPAAEVAQTLAEPPSIPTGADAQAVCDTARQRENLAYQFYHDLAKKADPDSISGRVFTFLATEEQTHMKRVDEIRHLADGSDSESRS